MKTATLASTPTLLALLLTATLGFGATTGPVARPRPRYVGAALMFSSGENFTCQFGNIDDAYIVEVTIDGRSRRPRSRFIASGGSGGGCAMLPIIAPVGSTIEVSGVLQDTASIPGASISRPNALVARGAASVFNPSPPIGEDCFNVEGFAAGLGVIAGSSEYDPTDPANRINDQGYGLFWYDSDSTLHPGPYSYTVTGCPGNQCLTAPVVWFNSDPFPAADLPTCKVLPPLF